MQKEMESRIEPRLSGKKQPLTELLLFTVISFSLPLLYVIPVCLFALDQKQIYSFLLYGFAAATPSAAAVLTIVVCRGKKGLLPFLRASFLPKPKVGSLILPLLLALGIALSTALLKMLVTGSLLTVKIPSATQMIVIAWALFSEELGWRGFLQKELEKKLPSLLVPLLVGLVWALWHYHFYATGNMTTPVFFFVAGCISDSYIYRFLLRQSEGGIIACMLYHMFGNLFPRVFLFASQENDGDMKWYMVSILVSCITAVILTVYSYRSDRRKQSRT